MLPHRIAVWCVLASGHSHAEGGWNDEAPGDCSDDARDWLRIKMSAAASNGAPSRLQLQAKGAQDCFRTSEDKAGGV
jgi:hypothetical protein